MSEERWPAVDGQDATLDPAASTEISLKLSGTTPSKSATCDPVETATFWYPDALGLVELKTG
ncbi:MAG: hypothetical protein ACI87E_005242 [Mariniblastus sp.]|jgi:hypothetical protein